jgi:hypothetical protein
MPLIPEAPHQTADEHASREIKVYVSVYADTTAEDKMITEGLLSGRSSERPFS